MSKDTDPTKDQRIDSYLTLNDAKDPAFEPDNKEHFIENDRSINTFNITVTLMLGL